MKEKRETEQEEFLKELIGKAEVIPEKEELFGDEELEHGEEENEQILDILEHGDLSTEEEAFENLAKALGKKPEEVMEIWNRGLGEENSEELAEAKKDSEIFEKLAEIRGISKKQMKEEILWALEKATVEKMVLEIQEENPGMNRKTAEELAKFRLGEGKMKKEPEKENWSGKLAELDGFLSKHSGETIEKLAKAVVEEWEGGIPLETAFEKNRLIRENEKLLEEIEKMKSEKEEEARKAYAREHGPGSATSAAGLTVRDEFIEGLFKEY